MPNRLSVSELSTRLARREVSARQAVQACLDQIQRLEPSIHAFISHLPDDALTQADAADQLLAAGGDTAKPLLGVPIATKDVIAVQGHPLNCGSKILGNFISPYDATVITKLKAAGAIILGRLNMDEFAMGSSTENSAIQRTANPWDLTRIPGGSSGGSAAVVAADEAFASLGSDTGGSIRQPASLCGCVGMKPTYGRVSRFGLIAFASSLDQIGPFTKTVEDSARMLSVLAGRDPQDSTSLELPAEDFTRLVGRDIKGLKIGMPKEYFIEGIDPQVDAAVRAAVRQYESLGAEIVEVSLPHTEYAVAVYYIIATAEASANLARYDGVRYGRRAEEVRNLQDLYIRSRSEGFGEEVKRRIILGTYVLSSGYYDAYYLRAQKVRTLIRQDFSRAFEKVDALICPTSPETAFKIGDRSDDPMKMYLADIFTIATNLAGIPGLSLPCGFAQVDGRPLPIGVQLLGKPLEEANLFQIAHAYEQSTPWHKARPTL